MDDHDRNTWSGMLDYLRTHHPGMCRAWFHDDLSLECIEAGVMYLRADSNVHRDYLHNKCVDPFNDAVRTVSGRLLSVGFLGPLDPIPRENPRPAASADTNGAPSEHDTLVINPDSAFENFIVGPGNRLAHAAAVAVAANPGRAYNPFFVHGDVGLGKTHLLQAICLRLREQKPDIKIYYTSCESFMTQFMDAVQDGHMSRFRHRFREMDVLVIDDIHFLAKRDRTQEEFFHTFNTLYQSNRQIVLSSDAPPEDIPDLEDRLVSRFKWGLVTSLAKPSYETRVAILQTKARLRGLTLPDDVACYVAGKIDTNIRELEGAIVKLQVLSTVEEHPIDLGLTQQAFDDVPSAPPREVQIQSIIDVVTDFFGVKVTELLSKRRYRSIALPRQICMYLARNHTRYSLEEIGLKLGGRDHTTVLYAVRTIEARREDDPDFARQLESLEHDLVEEPRA